MEILLVPEEMKQLRKGCFVIVDGLYLAEYCLCMQYPLLSRLFLSRYRTPGTPSIGMAESQLAGIKEYNKKCQSGEYSFERVPCLCGSTKSYCVGLACRYGLSTESHLCLQCGMLRTDPRPTEESLNKFYRELYGTIYEFAADQEVFDSEIRKEQRYNEQKKRGEWLYQEIKDQLPLDRTPKVFDIGCNSGAALLAFKEAGCECFGCDLGASGFERGRKEGLTLVEGDETVMKQFGTADFVFLSHVMEHLPHPDVTFKNIRGLLGDGGHLYIEVPGMLRFHTRKNGMMQFLQNAHLYHFSLGTLTDLARQFGFVRYKGSQLVSGFFTRDSREALPVCRHYLRPYLYLFYIFFVEILYRTRLLPAFMATYFFMCRGIRHMVWDIWGWIKKKC